MQARNGLLSAVLLLQAAPGRGAGGCQGARAVTVVDGAIRASRQNVDPGPRNEAAPSRGCYQCGLRGVQNGTSL
jgi:hypothetical protein